MYKLLQFPTIDERGKYLEIISPGAPLTKTAAEFSPETRGYIKQITPEDGKTYLLISAMGDGEFWGSNRNGDFFPTKALDEHHKTFESAYVYKHHANKDPDKAYGRVLFSARNPRMHRVELIIVIDHEKAPDVIERIENGEFPDVSMGCKVPYDICNYCGHVSRRVKDYCDDLRYRMNEIMPGGKKVYAINTRPRFFDLSFVFRGADKTGKTLAKVASDNGAGIPNETRSIPSAILAQEVYGEEKVAADPAVLSRIRDIGEQYISLLNIHEVDIPNEVIDKLATYAVSETLSTLAGHGIVMKPREFFRMALKKMAQHDWADAIERIDLDPYIKESGDVAESVLEAGNYNAEIGKIAQEFMAERSILEPYLTERLFRVINLPLVKEAADYSEEVAQQMPASFVKLLAVLGASFLAYRTLVPNKVFTEFDKWLTRISRENPGMAAAILAGGAGAISTGEKFISGYGTSYTPGMFEKQGVIGGYGMRVFAPLAGAYLARAHITTKAKHREPISGLERTVAMHPDIVGLSGAGALVLRKLQKEKPGIIKKIFSGFKKVSGYTPDEGKMPTPQMLNKMASCFGKQLTMDLVFCLPVEHGEIR